MEEYKLILSTGRRYDYHLWWARCGREDLGGLPSKTVVHENPEEQLRENPEAVFKPQNTEKVKGIT